MTLAEMKRELKATHKDADLVAGKLADTTDLDMAIDLKAQLTRLEKREEQLEKDILNFSKPSTHEERMARIRYEAKMKGKVGAQIQFLKEITDILNQP